MSEATSAAPERDVPRGRIDKRQAILSAAFAVFAREGYAQAGVSLIAAEAGVAKPTVYNHFGDKEQLFRATITAEADRAMATNLAVVERLTDRGQDLSVLLTEVGYELVQCYCDERSWAVRRLVYAELPQHAELVDIVRGRAADRVTEALADRLARLSLAGRLRRCDPVEAAEQLGALLTGSLESRARFGTRPIPDAEKQAVVEAAIRTFLHAFGPERT